MAGEDWTTMPFDEAVQVNPSVPLIRGTIYPFVDMQAVNPSLRNVAPSERRAFTGGGSRFIEGDTLMARITPCLENGKIARFVPDDDQKIGHSSTEFIIIRGRPNVTDNDFVYYLTKWNGVRLYCISQMTGSSGRQRVPTSALSHCDATIPPLKEQRAIAHILGSLDDKIELNRKMNEALEEMARAIFKSWFIAFDPVRAKAEGRDPVLPKEIADLFPARLVDSELGEIPEEWEVKRLGEICKKPQYGFTASAKKEVVGPKFLRITDINKLSWIEWATIPYCEISSDDYEKYKLQIGDFLIARMADPGHGVFIEEDAEAVFASYLIRFRPVDLRYGRYLQYWQRSSSFWNLINARKAGTTRFSLNAQDLSAFPLLIPSFPVLDAFSGIINPMRQKVVHNVRESQTLAAIRDALLPKLISGEIRVKT